MVVYVNSSNGNTDHPTFGRYSPSKDTIRLEIWRVNGTFYGDWTNSNYWWHLYYARRRHQNIPDNENIYDLFHLCYGNNISILWALNEDYT